VASSLLMARFKARVTRDAGGGFVAAAVELPNCWSRGGSADEALAKLRDEIRYRIEYCPCSGVADDFVELEPVPERGGEVATWRGVAGCGPAAASPGGTEATGRTNRLGPANDRLGARTNTSASATGSAFARQRRPSRWPD